MSKKKSSAIEKFLLYCMKDPLHCFIAYFWQTVDIEGEIILSKGNRLIDLNIARTETSLYRTVFAETDYDMNDPMDSPDDAIIRLFEETYEKLVK